jgi:hypothetical protein
MTSGNRITNASGMMVFMLSIFINGIKTDNIAVTKR